MKLACVVAVFLLVPMFLAAGDNQWSSGGPFGGDFTGITIHPQTPGLVFASGETLLRSTTNGSSWKSFDLGKDLVIRVSRRNPSLIVAASRGVFQSLDQGASWKLVSNNKFANDSLSDLELDPASDSVMYGVSYDHGVFKSVDGGKTWQARNSGLSFKRCPGCYDTPRLEIDPTNGNNLYVLIYRKLFKSTNGAQSWQPASSGLSLANNAQALAIDPSQPSTLYAGGDDGVFKTTNGGGSWASTSCGCQATDMAVDAANPQSIYVAYLGVTRSTDGGKSWKSFRLPAPSAYLASVTAFRNQVFAGDYNAGILRSLNSGGTWAAVNKGAVGANVDHLAASTQRAGVAFAVGSSILYRTADGSKTWSLVKGAANISFTDVQIHPQNANLVVGSSCCCAPAISTNGGATWRCGTAFSFGSDNLVLDPENQQTIYLTSRSQGAAKSTDQGKSWQTINSGLTDTSLTSVAIDPESSSTVFAGSSSGQVFKSVNGGSGWSPSSSGLNGAAPIIAIVVDPRNSNLVYLLTDYQGKGVYKSTNAGQSWTLKSKGLPTGCTSLVMHPGDSSILFAGGYGGAFMTNDGAESWSLFDTNGLGAFSVMNFLVNPTDFNTFFAATQHGVYSYKRTVVSGGPVIDRISPAAAKPGTVVTITGANFGPTQANSTITFGTLSGGTATSWSSNKVVVKVPATASTAGLHVTVASKSSNSYRFVAPAVSGKVVPVSGSTAGGNTITLTLPSMISYLISQLLVTFGGTVTSECSVVPPSYLVCTVPPGPTGTVQIQAVVNNVLIVLGTYTYGG